MSDYVRFVPTGTIPQSSRYFEQTDAAKIHQTSRPDPGIRNQHRGATDWCDRPYLRKGERKF